MTLTPRGTWSLAEVEAIPLPEYRPALNKAMSDLLTGSGAYDVEFMIRRRSDGELRFIHSRAELAPAAGDRPGTVLGTIEDITDRKQLEQQLLQAQKMESVGRLAGGVAHDFNNLLGVIQGYCSLLMGQVDAGHPFRADLEEIEHAALRAADLTRQLLAFSRRQVLKPAFLDLNKIVRAAERMLRRVIGEDIDLTTVPAPDLGRVFVDPVQVEQVIMNLAVNARDAMARGGKLTLETRNADVAVEHGGAPPQMAPGSYVMLAMSDTGEGMDAATRSRIFEPFFTTKSEKGTGLGLSTVYGIVHQSGGYVAVRSEPGCGTTFEVYLPRVLDDAAQANAVSERRPRSSRMGTETIMVVEDNEQLRALLCAVLKKAGHSVLAAAGAAEALRLEEGHEGPLHLLLTDVVMPGLNGRELAARLMATRPDLKVLYVSGYADDALGEHGVLAPGIAYLPKPFTPDTLLDKVRAVLDRDDGARTKASEGTPRSK